MVRFRLRGKLPRAVGAGPVSELTLGKMRRNGECHSPAQIRLRAVVLERATLSVKADDVAVSSAAIGPPFAASRVSG